MDQAIHLVSYYDNWRQDVRNRRAKGSWDAFESMLRATRPGNDGVVGFFYTDPEIMPTISRPGIVVFDAHDQPIDFKTLQPQVEVRSVVESQYLSMRLHAQNLGVQAPRKLIIAGGAVKNVEILRVIANVFNAPVYRNLSASNGAALGAAYRAMHGLAVARSIISQTSFPPFATKGLALELVVEPDATAVATYDGLLPRFRRLEQQVAAQLA